MYSSILNKKYNLSQGERLGDNSKKQKFSRDYFFQQTITLFLNFDKVVEECL